MPGSGLRGAVLAHSVRLPDRVLAKGHVLGDQDLRDLERAGVSSSDLHAVLRGPEDLTESEAARRIAQAVLGPGLELGSVAAGRANLFSTGDGVLQVDQDLIHRLNGLQETLTIATLASGRRVAQGSLVATAKVIPMVVPSGHVQAWESVADGSPRLRVCSFEACRVSLVLTTDASTGAGALDRAEAALRDRIVGCGIHPEATERVPHSLEPLTQALQTAKAGGSELVIVLGATQTASRDDVVPRALEEAGGAVHRFGIPVDPGNLMLWGRLGETLVIGAPGCARSPKRSGFDHVLELALAGIELEKHLIDGLGYGGLLREIGARGRPRLSAESEGTAGPVAGVLLAAGASRRMGATNKLLEQVEGESMVARASRTLVEAGLEPVVVVVGHDADRVRAALRGQPVLIVENTEADLGMSTSLREGVSAVEGERPDAKAAVVALADMPWVTPDDIRALVSAFRERGQGAVCVPSFQRKRGNPVLWGRRHFPSLRTLQGDEGARSLLPDVTDELVEVSVGHEGVLRDVDTPEALSAARRRGISSG